MHRDAARYKNKIVPFFGARSQLRLDKAECLAYHAPCTVALHRAAYLLAGDYPQPIPPPFVFPKIADKRLCDRAVSVFEKPTELTVLFYAHIFF